MAETRTAHGVVIAEDNPVVREVLRGVIRQDKRFDLIGEATNGPDALHVAERLKPALVCLDIHMPGLDGLSVLRRLREEHPDTRVVLVTGQSTSDVVAEALKLGAHGFVVKPFSADKLLRAMCTALGIPPQAAA